ncbi:hypothetical protein [Bacillus subtilis]|uniref:hypothetical protein n=1 Tax=Bacillus subtilis TaxID=1423 RepID=UPI001363C7A9|nr:hypothetical protein [Bacillus subtilis]QHM10540.1 hypothetical protein C7M28_02282 [Bacillus subtilis]UVW13602.1 hypothetical protein NX823_21730 [Bacillus subtilis]
MSNLSLVFEQHSPSFIESNDDYLAKRDVKTTPTEISLTNREVKSLAQLIDIKNTELDNNLNSVVEINSNMKLTLNELFYSLDSPSEIEFELRVYYGKAKFINENGHDVIKFTTEQHHKNHLNEIVTDIPSIKVFSSNLNKFKHLKELVSYLNTDKTFTCYYFGFPTLDRFIRFIPYFYNNLFIEY